MFLTGIDVIQYSKVANGHRCHVRFMVYDDAGSIYITYIVYAFNSVSRLQGLLSIAQSLPGVYTYANCTYKRSNTLWLENPEDQIREPIQGQEGSTQGAVDGAIFFNTAMNHVLRETNAALSPGGDGTMVAIADDIVGCVTPHMARQVLDIVVQRFHSLRLSLNYKKCHIFADTP